MGKFDAFAEAFRKKKEEEFKPTPKVENSTSTAKEIVKESTKAANKENTLAD